APLDDQLTFFLPVTRNADGTLGAFLRNPERNLGRFLGVTHVARAGRTVKLLRRPAGGGPDAVVASGTYDADDGVLAVYLPRRGRAPHPPGPPPADRPPSPPPGKPPAPSPPPPPPAEDDGWPVATLDDVGLSRDGIARFVQMLIDTPIDSVRAQDVHAVLIAR